MVRKNNRQQRKTSYNEGHSRVKYQEKVPSLWKCGVCEQIYNESQVYC